MPMISLAVVGIISQSDLCAMVAHRPTLVALTTIHFVADNREFEVFAIFKMVYPFWVKRSNMFCPKLPLVAPSNH